MARLLPRIGKVVLVKCRIKYGRVVRTMPAKRMYEAVFGEYGNYHGDKLVWIGLPDCRYSDSVQEISDVFSWKEIEY